MTTRSARLIDALRDVPPEPRAQVLHGARLHLALLEQDPVQIAAAARDVAPGLLAHALTAGAASLALISCEEREGSRILLGFLIAVLEGDAAQIEALSPKVDALVVDVAGFRDGLVEGQQQRAAIDRRMGQA